MNGLHIHCPHFYICSGCTRNEYVDRLPILEEAHQFFFDLGYRSFKLQSGSPIGWRCRAKLAVRGTAETPLVGLFKKGSHETINIPHCRVHHPNINHAIEILKDWIVQHEIQPYNEAAGTGLLRYVQTTVELSTQRIQLVLVVNTKEETNKLQEAIEVLWQAQPDLWHSIWLNLNTRRDNIIFGDEWNLIKGDFWLIEDLNKQRIYFHPGSFMQANLEMFGSMLEHIEGLLPHQADLIEFYAGVGAIGTAVVEKCQMVKSIELNPMAQECFEETRKHLLPELAERLSYHQGKSADYIDLLDSLTPDKGVVVVDPPRKGLEKEVLKALCLNKNIYKIIYVSCGWPSFQEDCQRLVEAGWNVVHAEAYLFFPGSDHIEILASFEKKKGLDMGDGC